MQMIEQEKQFLELAEKFQQEYCLLRDEVVNTQFADIQSDLHKNNEKSKKSGRIYKI